MIGLVYRIDLIRTTDNTWVVIPLWLTTSVLLSVPKLTLTAKAQSSVVQMTAGLLVCCMPSSAILFKRVKGPLLSYFQLSNHPRLQKALSPRSWASKSGSSNTKREKLGREEPEGLPGIDQRATMTGIRTFIDQQGRVSTMDAQMMGSFDQGESDDYPPVKLTGRAFYEARTY